MDKPDQMLKFNDVCRKRAQKGGPGLVITTVMDRGLPAMDVKTNVFHSRSDRQSVGRDDW